MNDDTNGLTRRSVLKSGAVVAGAVVLGASGTAAAGVGDGRVLDYHLNNVSYDRERGAVVASHVHDASTERNHGAWEGQGDDPVAKDGAVGNAYEFVTRSSADYDYVEVSDDASLDVTSALTLACWVNCSTQDSYARLVSREQSGAGNRQYNLGFDSSGTYPRSVLDTTAGVVEVTGSTDVTDETWHHLAMTFESDGELRMYVDGGNPEAAVPVSDPLVSVSANVVLGAAAHLPDKDSYDGLLDEVRVYDRALSQAAVTELATMDEE